MNQKSNLKSFLFGMLLMVFAQNAAALCTSSAKEDWNKAGIWTATAPDTNATCNTSNPKQGPSAGSDVVIANGAQIKVDTNTLTVANVTINAGATLQGKNGKTLTFSGNFTNNGTFTASGGTVVLAGSVLQTITGTTTFANLTFNNPAGVTISGNVTVTGTFTPGTTPITVPAGSTFIVNGKTYTGPCSGVYSATYCTAPSAPTVTTTAASALTTAGATLNGTVSSNNAATTVTFEYGLSAAYGSTATAAQSPLAAGANASAVSAAITGLSCNTLYHFRVKGVNSAGTSNGGDLTFTTAACPVPASCASGAIPAGVINTYYPGAASVTAGATSITLGASAGAATAIAQNDLLLIVQMQDANIDTTNTATYGTVSGTPTAGRYEYAVAAGPVSGGVLPLKSALTYGYTAAAYGTNGQKTFQVIRVPVYSSATLPASGLTAQAWNGSVGGVLAVDVTGALNLNGAVVDVSGKGFRGGASRNSTTGAGANTDYRTLFSNLANGSKGEGTAGTPRLVLTEPSTLTDTGVEGYPGGSFARGAPGNAGGGATDRNPAANDQNPGGGGGGNGGAGGLGGIGWCPTFNAASAPLYGCGPNSGGFGGAAVGSLGAGKLTMGGGGGAGTTNNATGALGALSTSGATGGGMIFIRAGSFTGTATFNANGSDANNTVRNDGNGGGGAGGAVMLLASSGMGGATVNVKGGKGGDNLVPPGSTSNPHGPGGGGGGGYALTSGAAVCNAAAGNNGVTYQAGVLFGAYGATPGAAGVCNSALTSGAIPGVTLGQGPCASSVDHYELSLPSTGVSCMSLTAKVTACADNSSPCTNAVTSINGETATLAASAGTLGSTTVTFNASGVATTTLSYPAAANGATTTLSLSGETTAATNSRQCCPDGANCVVSNSCSATFNTAGFIFSNTTGGSSVNVPAQTAGTSSGTYYLRAVKTNTTTQACEAGLTGPRAIDFGYECNDPATCHAANLMTVGTTTIARNNNGGGMLGYSYLPVNLTFDANGNAPFAFKYEDVGKVTLRASTTVNGAQLSGATNSFVVAPDHFVVAPSGPYKAGSPFSTTVTATSASGQTTPSFGMESTPEGVTMAATLVSPAGGVNPGLQNGSIAGGSFTNGVATLNNLSWGEVGNITLGAQLTSSSYLGSGQTASGSAAAGPFIPDHFDTVVVSSAGVPLGCPAGLTCPTPGMVYSGQPFSLQITARNLAGGTTKNYQGTFAKAVTLGAWDAAGGTTANPGGGTIQNNSVAASAFSLGVASSSMPGYSLPANTAPTDVYFRAVDADGVTSQRTGAVEGGVKVASGRIKVSNAYGSDKVPLTVPVIIQYYDGAKWVLSTTDGSTVLGGLNAPGATVVNAGTLSGGVLNGFKLSGSGSVEVKFTSPAFLTAVPGKVTFGIYKGSKEIIYRREAY
jgi:hypothetical protein